MASEQADLGTSEEEARQIKKIAALREETARKLLELPGQAELRIHDAILTDPDNYQVEITTQVKIF